MMASGTVSSRRYSAIFRPHGPLYLRRLHLDVALGTVYRVKQRFTEEGLAGVLKDRPQANRHRKLDDRGEAHLVALACSPAPEGHDHWTLRLLAGKVVELGLASSMSHEGVRQRLKKTLSSRGGRKSGASPR